MPEDPQMSLPGFDILEYEPEEEGVEEVELNEEELVEDDLPDAIGADGESWFIPDRRAFLTPDGLRWFKLFCQYEGRVWNNVTKKEFVAHYASMEGGKTVSTHTAETELTLLQRMGVMAYTEDQAKHLHLTPFGHQIRTLIETMPGLYLALPRLITQTLFEYQTYHPALRSPRAKNLTIFPYWFTFYVMSHCDNRLSDMEFLRFLYKARTTDQRDQVVQQVYLYRERLRAGASTTDLNTEFGLPLPPEKRRNYFLHPFLQCGILRPVGRDPELGKKNVYEISPIFRPFIRRLLSEAPEFRRDITRQDWMAIYGRAVPLPPISPQVKAVQVTPSTRRLTPNVWIASRREMHVHCVEMDDLLYFLVPQPVEGVKIDAAHWIFRVIDVQFGSPKKKLCTVSLTPAWKVTNPQFVLEQLQAHEQAATSDGEDDPTSELPASEEENHDPVN